MNILDQIYRHKLAEVEAKKGETPLTRLKDSVYFGRSCRSMRESLQEHAPYGIIAEFKRRSPSKGDIGVQADVAAVTGAYVQGGAAALSVLTDARFFGAQADDFAIARQWDIPILRKDFIVDAYQLVESKAMGADAVLLIAGMLEPAQLLDFCLQAQALGMEVLLETHTEEDISLAETIPAEMVGINNRSLRSFAVDVERSKRLCGILPEGRLKIAESGLDEVAVVRDLARHGFGGFLMGEYFMRGADCGAFIKQLRDAD
jgi:indole-3-glycerol phosphate synthase